MEAVLWALAIAIHAESKCFIDFSFYFKYFSFIFFIFYIDVLVVEFNSEPTEVDSIAEFKQKNYRCNVLCLFLMRQTTFCVLGFLFSWWSCYSSNCGLTKSLFYLRYFCGLHFRFMKGLRVNDYKIHNLTA